VSAFEGKADNIQGKADIKKCPLMTQSGHRFRAWKKIGRTIGLYAAKHHRACYFTCTVIKANAAFKRNCLE